MLLLAGGKNAVRVQVQVQVSHFSSEHFWVALLASDALGPPGPVCHHLTCGDPAQQEIPVWDMSFAPLKDVLCISRLGKIKGICYLAIFHLTHNL